MTTSEVMVRCLLSFYIINYNALGSLPRNQLCNTFTLAWDMLSVCFGWVGRVLESQGNFIFFFFILCFFFFFFVVGGGGGGRERAWDILISDIAEE